MQHLSFIGFGSRPRRAHGVDQALVLPSGNAAFLAARATRLKRAILAVVAPVATDLLVIFLSRKAAGQLVTNLASIDITGRLVVEVGLHKHALVDDRVQVVAAVADEVRGKGERPAKSDPVDQDIQCPFQLIAHSGEGPDALVEFGAGNSR